MAARTATTLALSNIVMWSDLSNELVGPTSADEPRRAQRQFRAVGSIGGLGSKARSLLHLDARYGMNLVPADTRRLRVMEQAARNGDMAADWRNGRMVVEPCAGGCGTCLCSTEVTNHFKHEIAALI